MNVIIAQFIGVIALLLTMMSVHQKEHSKMLLAQVISNLAYMTQYIFLYAWAGAAMTALAIVRCLVFYYYEEKNKPKSVKILIFLCLLMIGCGILTYDGPASILPIFVVLGYSYTMWLGNMKAFRIFAVIAPACWVIYDIYVSAFVATVASVIEFISAVFAVIRYDIDKDKEKEEKNII